MAGKICLVAAPPPPGLLLVFLFFFPAVMLKYLKGISNQVLFLKQASMSLDKHDSKPSTKARLPKG